MELLEELYNKITQKFSPQAFLVFSFFTVILIGSILLMQPFSLQGGNISFIDSLFTSASATCVTGLTVVDTNTQFSFIGKIILLALMQIGGIGVMSFSVLFLFFLKGKFGIGSREIIQETLSFFDTIDLRSLLRSVFIFAITIESIGAVLLTFRFLFYLPFEEALFAGIFHSISAFCNAGFSNFSNNLIDYQADYFINIVTMILIFLGGIGFIVLYELKNKFGKKFSFSKLSLHSKVAIEISVILILIGAIFIFVFEYDVSMKEMELPTKIIASIFHSVSSRTAGFNTVDLYNFSMPSLFILISLMFIGASPASTGGGVKTTTIAVIISFIHSRIKDSRNVNIKFNTLPFRVISKTIVILVFAITIVVTSAFLLTIIEMEHLPFNANGERFMQIYFEVVSAFGTVGLSTGITPELSILGKLLIIFLMFAGRVGPLTIASIIGSKETVDIRYAEDNILVG
ncbi:MAG: TrkH family potassium uptake protein [Melioribacteraceae bacterium]